MSILSQLTISAATPKLDAPPIAKFRRRLCEAIALQIEQAKAESSGETLRRSRERWVNDPATGERKLTSIPIRVKPWWWRDGTGKLQLSLRNGPRLLEISPGKSAIEIGQPEDLPAKLELVRQAISNGELDQCANITAVAGPAPARRRSTSKKTASKGD